MRNGLGISLLAIMVVLAGCNSHEANSKEKGSATEVKDEEKVPSRDDVKLADNEILVIDEETGESEKVDAKAVKNEKFGLTFKLPAYYDLKDAGEEYGDVTIEAPYNSDIVITPTPYDKDIVNKPTFETYLGSSYHMYSKDQKWELLDVSNSKDTFVKNKVIYMVEFLPKNESYKKMYGGLIQIGDTAYEVLISLGNNENSDDVYETTLGILAATK